jgi:DNA-binding NtrC family response regulator
MQRILVIDDDRAVRITVEAMLKREGYEVVCAVDGAEGIGTFERASPHLIVTDIIMPTKEGLETIVEIRSRDPMIPIIAISGGGRLHNADFLQMARKLGANEILAKPFTSQQLVGAIRRLLPVEDGG